MPGIYNLNDLFYALFHAENGEKAVIKGHPEKRTREVYFQMFFPEELCRQYLNKTKANLTWFFNNDAKNKAIKNTLVRMLETGTQSVITGVQQKCKAILYPQGQHPAFDRQELWAILDMVILPSGLNAKLHVKKQAGCPEDAEYALPSFYDADPSAAMARLILTLAILPGEREKNPVLLRLLERLWEIDPAAAPEPEWGDIPGRIRYGNMLFLCGNHEKAYTVYESIAQSLGRPAENPEESAMYCRMGRMLSAGDGHYRDENAARRYLGMGCYENNPESYYLLSKLSSDGEARKLLEKAAQLGHVPALRELGNAWYYGLGCGKDPEKALHCFSGAKEGPADDIAYCAYMRGRIYEDLSNRSSAIQAYRIAAEKGSEDAARRLEEISVFPDASQEDPEPAPDMPLRYCLINGSTGGNPLFVRTLPGAWEVTVMQKDGDLSALANRLFAPGAECFPELVIALLSEDQEDNLSQAVAALSTLEVLARALGTRKWEMAQKVMIYVEAEYRYASLMLDAAYAGVRSVTIPLRLCDPARDSADALFASAPLFLPCIRNKETETIHLVVLGSSDTAMAVVQRAVSMPLSEKHPVTICVIGEKTDAMERRFRELCPGVMDAAPGIRRSIPMFRECGLENGEVTALLRNLKKNRGPQKEKPGEDIAELLGQGNYFVVATDSDRQNIHLGTHLRMELLKLYPTFTNLPFIAVHVRNATAARLADNLSADGKTKGYSWHSRYDLHCFGAADQYTYGRLQEDITEKRAIAAHLQYAGEDQPRYLALESYYRRQYNRDSSRAAALYLECRLFNAGITLPDWKLYGIPDEEAVLGRQYSAWLEEDGNLSAAARMEHERWNCYMLSEGWEQASPSQVAVYVQLGNPTHQLYLGKLHPFLCPWEDLASGALLQQVTDAVHSRLPEKTIHDPRTLDTQTVQAAVKLLTVR